MLNKLAEEWVNRGSDTMVSLRASLERVRKEVGYQEAWKDLALGRLDGDARCPEYMGRLLLMIDERPLSMTQMQPLWGIKTGHVYRTLSRAGVEYRGSTSLGIRLRDAYSPWPCAPFCDPTSGRILLEGRYQAHEFEVEREDEGKVGAYFVAPALLTRPPLPIWRSPC